MLITILRARRFPSSREIFCNRPAGRDYTVARAYYYLIIKQKVQMQKCTRRGVRVFRRFGATTSIERNPRCRQLRDLTVSFSFLFIFLCHVAAYRAPGAISPDCYFTATNFYCAEPLLP